MDVKSNQHVTITGGLGFIGSNLAQRLVDGNSEITVIDSCMAGYGANMFNINGIEEDIEYINADVRNKEDIDHIIKQSDIVYHLAAQLSRPESNREPIKDNEINCRGLLNILTAAKEADNPPKIVFTSSQAVVGSPDNLPIDEDTPPNPLDIYGANKYAGENYCKIFHDVHDVPTVVLRLTNVYGPRAQLSNPNYGVIQKFIKLSLLDEKIPVFRPGTMTRDLIYVDNVVDSLITVAKSEKTTGEKYMVGSGEKIQVKELAEQIVDISESGTVEVVDWPDDWDSIRIGDLYSDPSKLVSETNWEPQIDITEGLEQTIQFYNKNIDEYID